MICCNCRSGVLQASQLTTRSLSFAVSRLFWDVVKESIQQQAQNFRGTMFDDLFRYCCSCLLL